MKLQDLKAGDVVRLRFSHWDKTKPDEIAKVIGRDTKSCQLHGDFIDTTILFRKHKGLNLRPSVLFEVEEHGGELAVLELADAATTDAVNKFGAPAPFPTETA